LADDGVARDDDEATLAETAEEDDWALVAADDADTDDEED
jgi:hypothetical protein